jgi:hypothetical protein
VWRIDIVRLAMFADPPTASQNEALNEVRILSDLNTRRRVDHTSRDPGKREPVDFPISRFDSRRTPLPILQFSARI